MKLFEIEEVVNQLKIPNFKGVLVRDQLINSEKSKSNQIECGIIHSHTTKENIESVGHWTAYYKNKSERYYFCPFGGEIYQELKDYLGLPIMTHNFIIQKFNETICGELSILFLYFMSKGLKYEDVILFLLR
jgi:hypothetical protein